jgi:energy-coupling factor transporter ATP-binding protein EcfA2
MTEIVSGGGATVATQPERSESWGEAIRLEGVRFQYPGARTWALDGVDLAVAPREIVGLVGANDAGKTTVCLVASGLAPGVTGGQLAGSARLLEAPTSALTPAQAASRCGVLFQQPRSQLSGTAVTVWEEIAFGPRNFGLPPNEIVERVESAMAVLGIEHLARRDPGRLSGGQGQLVALGSVLALRPTALVLDEPTSQLDPEGTRLVGEAIARTATEIGCAVLIVEHKTDLLAAIADRTVVIDRGRTVAAGPTVQILASDTLTEIGVDAPSAVRLGRAGAGLAPDLRARLATAIAEAGAR